jgi:Fe2+ transport system protein FeoA
MTELETAIRDALQARADAVEPRYDAVRARRPRRWLAPTVAAAVVVALAAITVVFAIGRDGGGNPPSAPRQAAFVGYSWRLVRIDDRQGRLTLPVSTKAEVAFAHGGAMTGDDTVHGLQVRYRIVAGGYQPTGPVFASANGLAGPISIRLKRTLIAVGRCFSSPPLSRGIKPLPSAPIAATVDGDRLTIRTSEATMTFVRGGRVVEIKG